MPDDLNSKDASSIAETAVARVCLLTELADTATRYMRALNAGDDESAARELGELSKLCEERAGWSKVER